MSTLVLVLAAGMTVPGDVPKEVSGEIEERLDLRGRWEGTWQLADGQCAPAVSTSFFGDDVIVGNTSDDGCIILCTDFLCDEGCSRFSIRWEDGRRSLGIYQQDRDRVVLCFRAASEGYPISFRGGRGQSLLILHRVQPSK